jgi:hypothetical protein
MWRPGVRPDTVTWTDSYLEDDQEIVYTMKPEVYDQSDHLEWVQRSYLLRLVRERDEAEARAILAEAEADAALTLLDEYAARIEELEERLKEATGRLECAARIEELEERLKGAKHER